MDETQAGQTHWTRLLGLCWVVEWLGSPWVLLQSDANGIVNRLLQGLLWVETSIGGRMWQVFGCYIGELSVTQYIEDTLSNKSEHQPISNKPAPGLRFWWGKDWKVFFYEAAHTCEGPVPSVVIWLPKAVFWQIKNRTSLQKDANCIEFEFVDRTPSCFSNLEEQLWLRLPHLPHFCHSGSLQDLSDTAGPNRPATHRARFWAKFFVQDMQFGPTALLCRRRSRLFEGTWMEWKLLSTSGSNAQHAQDEKLWAWPQPMQVWSIGGWELELFEPDNLLIFLNRIIFRSVQTLSRQSCNIC